MARRLTNIDVYELAELLACGTPIPEIAAAVGLTVRSVYRYIRVPQVREIVDRVREGNFRAISGKLQGRTMSAANRIAKLMRSEDERISLAASKLQLDISLKLVEMEGFAKQIETLRSEVESLRASLHGESAPAKPAEDEYEDEYEDENEDE
jgi:hypothetical protein